ncbi:MAG: succinylglutamate desuccinylase/aspartoacylase family protein, partial [Bacteroidota bacterium]
VYGFIRMDREFPDGRDLNRVFPGTKNGSLASRVANKLMTEVVPYADLVLDFHTGGADRFNAAQIRIIKNDKKLENLAHIFGAPIVFYTKHIAKSFRSSCYKLGIPILLFEGGKSFHIDDTITNTGVNGAKRVLHHMGMLKSKFKVSKPKKNAIKISNSKWVRATHSGMFKPKVLLHSGVKKGDTLGHITDPYGNSNFVVKAPNDGYIFNVNQSPIIYQGDAIFHISTELEL